MINQLKAPQTIAGNLLNKEQKLAQLNKSEKPQITEWIDSLFKEQSDFAIVNIADFNNRHSVKVQKVSSFLKLLIGDEKQIRLEAAIAEMEILRKKDMPYKDNGVKYYKALIQKVHTRNSFLTPKSVMDIINVFNNVNRDLYFPNGTFNYEYLKKMLKKGCFDESFLTKQPFFNKMVETINEFIASMMTQCNLYFQSCQKQFKRGEIIKENKQLQKNIWDLFDKILRIHFRQIENPFISHGNIFNLIANGLNYCYLRDKRVFDQRLQSISRLAEFVVKLKYNVQKNYNSETVQSFLVNLELLKRYKNAKPKQAEEICEILFQISEIGENMFARIKLIYLGILIESKSIVNQQQGNILQFQSEEEGEEVAHILWNILETNPFVLWEETYQNNRHVWHYLASIFYINSDKDDISKDQRFCTLIKIINLVCFDTKKEQSRLSDFLHRIQSMDEDIFEYVHKLIFLFHGDGTSQSQLVLSNASLQDIYTFVHNVIIHDQNDFGEKFMKYLLKNKNIKKAEFYQHVFGDYLYTLYSEGMNTHICLSALTVILHDSRKNYQYILANIESRPVETLTILQNLLKEQKNYQPIIKQMLFVIKNNIQELLDTFWFIILSHFTKKANYSINNNYYAGILLHVLRQLYHKPKLLPTFIKHFNFQALDKYFSEVLDLKYMNSIGQYQKVYNCCIKKKDFQSLKLAIDLLKIIVALYKLQRQSNQHEILPYSLTKMIETLSNQADYQIKLKKYGTNYETMMIILYTSIQFQIDKAEDINLAALKNDILELLIDFNKINKELKSQSIFVDRFEKKNRNTKTDKRQIFYNLLCDQLLKRPNYLLLKYLLDNKVVSNHLQQFFSKKILNNKENTNEISIQSIKNKSSLINFYQQQLQYLQSFRKKHSNKQISAKQSPETLKVQKMIKESFVEINSFLRGLSYKEKQENSAQIQYILENIYKMLRNISKVASYHDLFRQLILQSQFILLDIPTNQLYIMEQNVQSIPSMIYRQLLLTFFNSQRIVSPEIYSQMIKNTHLSNTLYVFVKQCLERLQNGEKYCQNHLWEFIQFALYFMINLLKDYSQQFWQFNQILSQIHKEKDLALISQRQILIILIINTYIGNKLQNHNIYLNANQWPLAVNFTKQNVTIASMILKQLDRIHQNPVFFMNCCKYLIDICRSSLIERLFENKPEKLLEYIINILQKSIKNGKSYYAIWIIEILIEIIVSKRIELQTSKIFLKIILNMMLKMNNIRNRLTLLIQNFQNTAEMVIKDDPDSKNVSLICFKEKNELLAYFRLFSLIFFNEKYEIICKQKGENTETSQLVDNIEYFKEYIQGIMFRLIEVLISCFKKAKLSIAPSTEWEKHINQLEINEIIVSNSIQQSSLRRYNAQKLNQFWQNFNFPPKGRLLFLFDDVLNIQISSFVTLWLSSIKNSQKLLPQAYKILNLEIELQIKLKTYIETLSNKQHYDMILECYKIINKKIYLSEYLQKQILFTNDPYLSSNLVISYQDIKQKLAHNFYYCHKILQRLKETYNYKEKLSDLFLKRFTELNRKIRIDKIKEEISGAGIIIQIEDQRTSNQSIRTNQRFTTITKTIRAP